MNTKRRAHCQLWHDWKERIIRIGDEQTSLQNQFDNLRNEFTDNSPRLEALETKVNALDGRVIIAESDISEAEDRITACEADIDRIDAELVDKTGEINNLANRVTLAEADIDDIDARLDGIEAGEILLSQLNIDSDKDWQGRTISNVDLNNVTYGDYHIEPRFLGGEGLIFDGQPGFMNRDLKTLHNPQYIEVEGAPHPVALTKTGNFGIGHMNNRERMVRVSPGDRVTLTATARVLEESGKRGKITLSIETYDSNKVFVISKRIATAYYPEANDIWDEYVLTATVPEGIYYISPYIYINDGISGVTTQICDFKIYKNYNRNIAAKLATLDGVIIRDGGTVDGVDISTHTHDGTAIGGPKISYNNLTNVPDFALLSHKHDGTSVGGPKISYNDLVDKPDIPTSFPKLPMPYRKTVSINLPFPESYIDILDIIPEGRTALTVEQLKYRSIANVNYDTGPYVAINIIFDDNTVVPAIDRITKNGDTDWHPPGHIYFYSYNYFAKNYIKGIRIIRSVHPGDTITGYVDIIGHVY